MKLIYISRLTFNSCGGTDQNDFLIINSTKINLSSVLYLTNVTGLVINDTTFWRSAGYIIIMAEVVNACYHKVQFSSNKVVPFLGRESFSYDGWVLTFLLESKSEEVNTFQISNCQFYSINATNSGGDNIFDSLKNLFLGKGRGLSFFTKST